MDLRDIDELGFASFGQLLNQKADFRILEVEGILKNFNHESLEKIFQLPYGLEINADKEYLSFVKISALSGDYGKAEQYIFIIGYKFAGIDKNKRKNYYGGCLAYKYDGYVIVPAEALSYLSMVLDLSKSLIIENRSIPLKPQSFRGEKKSISFKNLSTQNNFVIFNTLVKDEVKERFIEYNYRHSDELAPVHRLILALGSAPVQKINSFEIKALEVPFEEILKRDAPLFKEKEVKFKEAEETENNKFMLENKNDTKIDDILNSKLKPLNEKLDLIEEQLSKVSRGKRSGVFVRNIDKVFLVLIILLAAALFFVLREVSSITITTKASTQQVDAKTVQDIEKLVSMRIDSISNARKGEPIIYVAGKNDNISRIAEKYKVTPDMIVNKNSSIKVGDTLIIKR